MSVLPTHLMVASAIILQGEHVAAALALLCMSRYRRAIHQLVAAGPAKVM